MKYLLSDFDFYLPNDLIAKHPVTDRSSCKLLHLNSKGEVSDYKFSDITSLLGKNDLLVLNDSRVMHTYLKGKISGVDGFISVYLVSSIDGLGKWKVFVKPKRKVNLGSIITFNDILEAIVTEDKLDSNMLELDFKISDDKIFHFIDKIGYMPIPPYLKREPELSDYIDYQTVFAKKDGSVAAPTAGLHFDLSLLEKIAAISNITYITLHVGIGTFLPVKTSSIEEHKMHTERFIVSEDSANAIKQCKSNGGKVISVGTTTLRVIEHMMKKYGDIRACSGETDIFIRPGFKFQCVDSLITNFHTPKSTLFILVSAFSGLKSIKNAYNYAIEKRYRFFSYGDACLLDLQSAL